MSTLKTTKYNEFVRAYARKCRRDKKQFRIADAARLWSRLEGGSWANFFNPAKVPTQADYDKALDNYADMQKVYADRKAREDENKASSDALAKDLAKERADAALFRAQNPNYGGKLAVTKTSAFNPPPGETTYRLNSVTHTVQGAAQAPARSSISPSDIKVTIPGTQRSVQFSQTREPSRPLFSAQPAPSRVFAPQPEPSRLYSSRETRPSGFLGQFQEPERKSKSECDSRCKKWLKDNYTHLTGHHHFRDTKSFVNHLLKE